MAEGGIAWRSVEETSSAEADECFCDPCRGEGDWTAAVGYCEVCEEYLCRHCLRVHRKQKISRGHNILDKDQMPQDHTSTIIPDICVKVCKIHHPEIVRFYCRKHDETGCVDCMILNHANCIKDRIQDISLGFKQSDKFIQIKQRLLEFHEEIEKMRDVLVDQMHVIDESFSNMIDEVEAARKKINDYLDEMEKEIKDEATKMKEKDKENLEVLIADNESMLQELTDLMHAVQSGDEGNLNSLFIDAKEANQRLLALEEESRKFNRLQQRFEYKFQLAEEIQNIISSKPAIGKLYTQFVQHSNNAIAHQSQYGVMSYTASYVGGITVKANRDERDCNISDCALLNPDRLVVADTSNNKVKVIDLRSKKILFSYRTPSQPTRLAVVDRKTIAVTLPQNNEIQILKVSCVIEKEDVIKTRKNELRTVSYKNGKFAVGYFDPGIVDILDIEGYDLFSVHPKQEMEDVLLCPFYIKFGNDDGTLIVSDLGTDEVSVVSFAGQILRTFRHEALVNQLGIEMTSKGVLFVCSWHNGCVHAISPDFKTSKIIISDDSNLKGPVSIAYCETNHLLYISNEVDGLSFKNNMIQIYKLQF